MWQVCGVSSGAGRRLLSGNSIPRHDCLSHSLGKKAEEGRAVVEETPGENSHRVELEGLQRAVDRAAEAGDDQAQVVRSRSVRTLLRNLTRWFTDRVLELRAGASGRR